jgi:hypothetical protein
MEELLKVLYMLSPKFSSLRLPALALVVLFSVRPALPNSVYLTSTSSPGTSSFGATFLTEDTLLHGNDTFSQSQAGAGSASSQYSNIQWTGRFGDLHALAASALPGDTSLFGATAIVGLEWTDYFNLTTADLLAGPPSLNIQALLNGTTTVNFNPSLQHAAAFGGAGLDDALTAANLIQSEMCTDLSNPCSSNLFDDTGLAASTAAATVLGCPITGCWVALHGWLEADAQSINLNLGAASSAGLATADFSHTATFKVDLLTSDWTISSLSGTDYSSGQVTPEPATNILCGSCLVALGLGWRRLAKNRKWGQV